MHFRYRAIGEQRAGSTVTVSLRGSSANVRLLDEANFRSYQRGLPHAYAGRFARRSPVRITIPHNGRWYVVADLGGYKGSVRITDVEVSPSTDGVGEPEGQHVVVGPAPSRLR